MRIAAVLAVLGTAVAPTPGPSAPPSVMPSVMPSSAPSASPAVPSKSPSAAPTGPPTASPSLPPSKRAPTAAPKNPTVSPSLPPTKRGPTASPVDPTTSPSLPPTKRAPTTSPVDPTRAPSAPPAPPTTGPQQAPTKTPSLSPTSPTRTPSQAPSGQPSRPPSAAPSKTPSQSPSKFVFFDAGAPGDGVLVSPIAIEFAWSPSIMVAAAEDDDNDSVWVALLIACGVLLVCIIVALLLLCALRNRATSLQKQADDARRQLQVDADRLGARIGEVEDDIRELDRPADLDIGKAQREQDAARQKQSIEMLEKTCGEQLQREQEAAQRADAEAARLRDQLSEIQSEQRLMQSQVADAIKRAEARQRRAPEPADVPAAPPSAPRGAPEAVRLDGGLPAAIPVDAAVEEDPTPSSLLSLQQSGRGLQEPLLAPTPHMHEHSVAASDTPRAQYAPPHALSVSGLASSPVAPMNGSVRSGLSPITIRSSDTATQPLFSDLRPHPVQQNPPAPTWLWLREANAGQTAAKETPFVYKKRLLVGSNDPARGATLSVVSRRQHDKGAAGLVIPVSSIVSARPEQDGDEGGGSLKHGFALKLDTGESLVMIAPSHVERADWLGWLQPGLSNTVASPSPLPVLTQSLPARHPASVQL
eukprot:TRINITY_DN39261_c0_g1_i1.p1 TRINITY_DN39261_c0_g1~~TRINITY_DN39261_c0_g1_i1.p1  ORF type:complete len:666 (+),score=184.55 TRINITY_DN39261_c0_g1_i1:69-2000(+)